MPSRAAHLVAFLTITFVSVGCHIYVFRQLARMIRKDFPGQAKWVLRIAKALFIYFDLPFIYIFFWRHITADVSDVTRFLLYPFAVWQIVMLVWAAILIPLGVIRSKAMRSMLRSGQRVLVKPITKAVRRSLRPRRDVVLETSEEMV